MVVQRPYEPPGTIHRHTRPTPIHMTEGAQRLYPNIWFDSKSVYFSDAAKTVQQVIDRKQPEMSSYEQYFHINSPEKSLKATKIS